MSTQTGLETNPLLALFPGHGIDELALLNPQTDKFEPVDRVELDPGAEPPRFWANDLGIPLYGAEVVLIHEGQEKRSWVFSVGAGLGSITMAQSAHVSHYSN